MSFLGWPPGGSVCGGVDVFVCVHRGSYGYCGFLLGSGMGRSGWICFGVVCAMGGVVSVGIEMGWLMWVWLFVVLGVYSIRDGRGRGGVETT